MLDYCLFMTIFNHEISTIKIFGDDFSLHSKVNNLIQTKQITQSDKADLILIFNESPQFIDYFWRNALTESTKWLIISARNLKEGIIIYKELRSFGDCVILKLNKPIIIIKNLKENFKNYFRQDILLEIQSKNINHFLEIQDDEQDLSSCQVCSGTKDEQLIQSMLSKLQFVYFGDAISNEDLNRCQMLANMKFCILECVNQNNFETIGYFVHRDFLEKTIIYSLTSNKTLENVFKFNEIKLSVAV